MAKVASPKTKLSEPEATAPKAGKAKSIVVDSAMDVDLKLPAGPPAPPPLPAELCDPNVNKPRKGKTLDAYALNGQARDWAYKNMKAHESSQSAKEGYLATQAAHAASWHAFASASAASKDPKAHERASTRHLNAARVHLLIASAEDEGSPHAKMGQWHKAMSDHHLDYAEYCRENPPKKPSKKTQAVQNFFAEEAQAMPAPPRLKDHELLPCAISPLDHLPMPWAGNPTSVSAVVAKSPDATFFKAGIEGLTMPDGETIDSWGVISARELAAHGVLSFTCRLDPEREPLKITLPLPSGEALTAILGKGRDAAAFCHRKEDLKENDYFLAFNNGSPVAFQFGEIETRDGRQPDGPTRLWDGSPYDLFSPNQRGDDAKIRIVTYKDAVACAQEYRRATS